MFYQPSKRFAFIKRSVRPRFPRDIKKVAEENSFGEWLRDISLKKSPRVYLFNGKLRDDQSTHFAVLDMPVGNKDLQ